MQIYTIFIIIVTRIYSPASSQFSFGWLLFYLTLQELQPTVEVKIRLYFLWFRGLQKLVWIITRKV